MFLGMPLPTWKQIFTKNKLRNKRSFYEDLMPQALFLAESCMSINLVLNAVREVEGKVRVRILLPDYFCNQTLYSFQEDWMDIIFYPIAEDMEPDWDYLKRWVKENEFDVMLFTHYFGKFYNSISRANELCKNHEAILIEDCAHVLYPTGKMGITGDFVIYSPHKQLPIQDGAVLVCNENQQKPIVASLNTWIKQEYKRMPFHVARNGWYLKKSLQKIIPIHRGLSYYSGIHYDKSSGDKHIPKKISKESYNTLCDYEYVDYKKAAYIRRDNLEMMNYIMAIKYPDVIPLMDSSVDAPYFAVYSLKNVLEKTKIAKDMLNSGFTVLYWPDLPVQLNELEGHAEAKALSQNIIILPIHQDLRPQKLAMKFLRDIDHEQCKSQISEIEWLNDDIEERNKYTEVYKMIGFSNIPQFWDYGTVKKTTEGSDLFRGIIKDEGKAVGIVQVLLKKKMGIPIVARVNRGPLFIMDYDSSVNHLKAMDLIRQRIPHPLPIIYAANIENSPKNIELLTKRKWRQWNPFGYETGIIDLNPELEVIRKGFHSKWRNQLKAAEKNSIAINCDFERFNEIKVIYEFSQKEKGYIGIPSEVLDELKALNNSPLRIFYITNEKKRIIAFDIFFTTENFGLYFVGWNDEEGRKMYANNLLLYHAVKYYKKMGCRWLDLGGIDYIDTEENARFKDGLKPTHVRLAGEFIKF